MGGTSRESKGMQGEVLPGQPLKIFVQDIFGLSWVFLGKKLGSGKPPIIPSWEIFQEGIIAGLKSGI